MSISEIIELWQQIQSLFSSGPYYHEYLFLSGKICFPGLDWYANVNWLVFIYSMCVTVMYFIIINYI